PARRDERPAPGTRRPIRRGAGGPPAHAPRRARARAPRLPPLRRAHGPPPGAGGVPPGARDRDGHPLPRADPPPAGRRAVPPARAAAHGTARRGDPEPADVGEPHRGGDRCRRRRGAGLLRALSTPLRILQIYPKDDYFTGAAVQLRELTLGLKGRGHEVVVATRPSETWAAKLNEAGVAHEALPMRSEVDLRSVRRLVRILKTHRIQVVHARKGNDDTIDALALVAPRAPRARLLVVGARGPQILHDRARARGVEDRVHVLGYREDVPEILAGSDCCVDASYAGLGITGTLREALAVETAVIASDLEGNPELVNDGETGLLFPPRDVKALGEAMLR